MRRLGAIAGGLALLALTSSPALARKGKKQPPPEELEQVTEAPVPPALAGIFSDVLAGWDHGGVPKGQASASAQACNACHYSAHDGWAASGHNAQGSEAFRTAVAEVGTPACSACHTPLLAQRPALVTYDAGDVNAPILTANPTFDPTLHTEGVTCAACHVRDGTVVATTHQTEPPPAHPEMSWSEELGTAEACAACHQVSWEGADLPLYDTFGEWQRSGYAEAGVGCTTCHLAADTAAGSDSHALHADPARALTVDIAIAGLEVVRGGDPVEATIGLTNTGAGHAMPTGSPWKWVELSVALVGPGKKGPATEADMRFPLRRTLSDEAPWATVEDTRLAVGERRDFVWTGELPREALAGDWSLVVRLYEVVRGQAAPQPFVERRLHLAVD